MSRKKSPVKTFGRYLLEFLTVFAGIMLAFALNKWNENRKEATAETKILLEIKNGLELDILDNRDNVLGHERGIVACAYYRDLVNDIPVMDSLASGTFYSLLRDYISIQNKSGYESLKSRGLELVSNDSLRSAIIQLYEFEHQALGKLEEEYTENQFFDLYFHTINDILAPHMLFNDHGALIGFKQPLDLPDSDRNRMLMYLSKIESNRKFMLAFYKRNSDYAETLIAQIDQELE